jgi:hypothetical protein
MVASAMTARGVVLLIEFSPSFLCFTYRTKYSPVQ